MGNRKHSLGTFRSTPPWYEALSSLTDVLGPSASPKARL